MKRADLIVYLRVAGYHDDERSFMRLYCENRISHPAAREAYRQGQAQKAGGVKCGCHECNS